MKKYLLIIIALFIAKFAISQNINATYFQKINTFGIKDFYQIRHESNSNFFFQPIKKEHINKALTSNNIDAIKFASSTNLFTLLNPQTTCLNYNKDLNAILFTHRGGGEFGLTGNDIICSYSTTGGSTWNSFVILQNGPNNKGVKNCRYPSGVIYNPTNNTDINKAFAVVCGINTIGTYNNPDSVTNFKENYFANESFDMQNKDSLYLDFNQFNLQNVTHGLSIINDSGKVYTLGLTVDTTTAYSLVLNTGKFNNNLKKFDWTRQNISLSTLKITNYTSAFSKDGKIGYLVMIGRDTLNDFISPQPIIYKTIDGGLTWNLEPAFDFGTLSELADSLRESKPDPKNGGKIYKKPVFENEFSTIVDANGDLHIFSVIYSLASYGQDTLTYWVLPAILYDIYTSSNGWKAKHIKTLYSMNVREEDGAFQGNDNVGWDHRVMASRSTDGKKVFCFWTDTEEGNSINLFPDLFGWGYDINSKKTTEASNLTSNTDYSQSMYFIYVPNELNNDGMFFNVPVTYAELGFKAGDPINHYFLKGIQIQDPSTVGIQNTKPIEFSISQNYPNPTNKQTSFTINLFKSADVFLTIYNAIGQKMISISEGKKAAGSHLINIDCSYLPSGLYFYEVKVDGQKITQKMIIE